MNEAIALNACSLCGLDLCGRKIVEAEKAFCCPGCHAVYNILSAKGVLGNHLDHPVFLQAVKVGLISNPALLEQVATNASLESNAEYETLHLEIGEMWCPSCAQVLQWVLEQEKGIRKCLVDYATDLAIIDFAPKQIAKDSILSSIRSLGYQPHYLSDIQNPPISTALMLRFSVAAFCALNLMMFSTPLYASYLNEDDQGFGTLFAWISLFTALPVLLYSAYPILKRSWTTLSLGILSMETLVVIGVSAAFGMSLAELMQGGNKVYFDSMAVIIAFMLLGKIIESKAKFSSKSALFRVMRSLPKRGRKKFPDGTESHIPIKDISLGDSLVALTGEKIVLDGVVVEGVGSCDESLLTGEPLPVLKKCGDRVLAGSVLQQGRLIYIVKASSEESALQKIVALVGQEMAQKSGYVRLPDRIVQGFVPLILLISLLTALVCLVLDIEDPGLSSSQTALQRAVAVLLISCPCAIGIAAPIAESRLMHALADLGAVVRNRGVLRYLGKETIMLFDKTGTLTKGVFQLVDGLHNISRDSWNCLKGLAACSIHPLSKAIKDSIPGECSSFDHSEEIAGKGLLGYLGAETYVLGSKNFVEASGCPCPESTEFADTILTYVYFGRVGFSANRLALGDNLRDNICVMLRALEPLPTMLISGDSPQTTAKVAEMCGIPHWKGACSPEEKRAIIKRFHQEGHIVAMVGDGINDAPALTASHVGVSAVNAADISIQVSDILLTTDRLQVLPEIRKLASKGRRIIHQNLFWAFFYNFTGLIWAVRGDLTPLVAAIAMVASSVFVICNAKRL